MDQPTPNSVHLTVSDIKKSIKFFTDKLGFKVTGTHPNEKKPVWAGLALGNQTLMIGSPLSPEAAKAMGMSKEEIDMCKKEQKAFTKGPHGVGAVFYFQVDDVDAHYKIAKKKKAEVLFAPKTQFYGLREYLMQDLDGYRFVFYTRIAQDAPPAKGEEGRPTTTAQPGEKEEEAVADA